MILSRSNAQSKVEVPMAPMIDIVFQLLIFFMLNLKIVAPEGNFNVNLPSAEPDEAVQSADIRVSLKSDREGNLVQLTLGQNNLGNDNAAFDRLNTEILKIIGRPGNPQTKDLQVTIDADFECQYKYIVKAISRCTGRVDPTTQQITRYVERIKFAPAHLPKG